jgi:hypothetical protein
MRNRRRLVQGTVLLAGVALTVLAPRRALAQFGGKPFSTAGPNCEGLKLQAATGVVSVTSVVGTRHTYSFVGTCFDGAKTFPAAASVEWDRTSFSLRESFRILGTFVNPAGKSYSGSVQSLLKCNEDPLVLPQAACNGVVHNNETGAKFLSRPYLEQHRPITKGKTTFAEAKALLQLPQQQRWPISCGFRDEQHALHARVATPLDPRPAGSCGSTLLEGLPARCPGSAAAERRDRCTARSQCGSGHRGSPQVEVQNLRAEVNRLHAALESLRLTVNANHAEYIKHRHGVASYGIVTAKSICPNTPANDGTMLVFTTAGGPTKGRTGTPE